MRLIALTALGDPAWDAAVASTGLPIRFSHRAVAGRAFEAAYESHTYAPYRAEFDDGTVLLLPLVRINRRLDSLSMLVGMPLGLEGTPLAAAGAARGEHLLALFRALPDCGSLIVSGGAGGSPPAAGVLSRSVTHVLDLQPGFDAVWNERFSAKNRNMCRKADRGGVVVNAESSQEAARAYHALYAAAAEDREQQADRYPQALFSAFLESGSAELWLARADSEVVAGALLLRGSQDLLYWSGAMKREHRHLAPSNAVLRAAIASGCERGFRYFDFGASTGLSGVEAFKRSFGAQPRACFSTALSTRRNRQLERARRLLARSTKASLTSP